MKKNVFLLCVMVAMMVTSVGLTSCSKDDDGVEVTQSDLMAHPEWLAQFPGAMKSAMWYWKKHRLNALADRDDVMAITRMINGGLNGIDNRKYLVAQFKKVLGV